jgi:hypothetical protein
MKDAPNATQVAGPAQARHAPQWTHAVGAPDERAGSVSDEPRFVIATPFFVVSLPVEEPDPVERLRRMSAETVVCKRAGDPFVLDTLLRDLGHVAPPLRRALERLAGHPRAFALNVSSLAGPVERPSVLGAPVRALYSDRGDR